MQRDSPWRLHSRNFVQGYEGVQTYWEFEDKNLQNLLLMLNENVQLRRSFLTNLEGLLKNKSNKARVNNWFVDGINAQRYMTAEFQNRNFSGAEETVSNVFLMSLLLSEEIKCMIKFNALKIHQSFYHCKQCGNYGIGDRCFSYASHRPKSIRTYTLPEFSYKIWMNYPEKFLEGMCYISL